MWYLWIIPRYTATTAIYAIGMLQAMQMTSLDLGCLIVILIVFKFFPWPYSKIKVSHSDAVTILFRKFQAKIVVKAVSELLKLKWVYLTSNFPKSYSNGVPWKVLYPHFWNKFLKFNENSSHFAKSALVLSQVATSGKIWDIQMFHSISADNLFDSVATAPQSLTMQPLTGCWSTYLRDPWNISLSHHCIELGVQIHDAQRQLWNPQGSVDLSLSKVRLTTLSLLPLSLQPPADICMIFQLVNKCGLIVGNICVFFKVFYTLCESLHKVRYKTCNDFELFT